MWLKPMNKNNMTREELITEIRYLLFNQYIDPDLRLDVFDKLDSLQEEKLEEWLQVLRDKIAAMGALEKFVHDVEKTSAEINDSRISYQNRLKKHPLFSLRLPKIKERLKNKLLDYIKTGVDIKQEYELYLNSQRDYANVEENIDFEIYEVKDVRQAFLDGMLACEQEFNKKKGKISVHDLLVQYDRTYNPASQKRAAFERNEIIESVGLDEKQKQLARTLLDTYDYVVYEDALVLDDDAKKFLEELRKNTATDVVVNEIQTQEKKTVPKVQSQPQQKQVAVTNTVSNQDNTPKVPVSEAPIPKPETTKESSVSRIWMPDVNTQAERFQQQRIDTGLLLNQLHQALLQRNTVVGLASLKVLADRAQVNLLLNDRRLVQLLMAKYRQVGNKDAETSLAKDSITPVHLRNLMKHLLVERLRLSENDGARVASDLIGVAREKGERVEYVSYLDEADEKYYWL
jgi:hypothetical protein